MLTRSLKQALFLQCRDGQTVLSNAQQLIRRVPGLSAHKADEICEILMKAGQVFNLAVKSAVEDWADQKLQGHELKKTISNWDHIGGRPNPERENELLAAHGSTFDLRCQLQTLRERFENVQFEAQCIITEFEKVRSLDQHSETYRRAVMSLHQVSKPSSYVCFPAQRVWA